MARSSPQASPPMPGKSSRRHAKQASALSRPRLDAGRTRQPKAIFEAAGDTGFATTLLGWYDEHARPLPWRKDQDPYHVWLSEIMLQQTRVAAVLEHYRKFLKKFPKVNKLARARESSVLAAWSGLGYYRRARMLHASAKAVVKEHDGRFPSTAAGLRGLPGIGRYTAAAIASISFDEPVAVVDGNVERVISRLIRRRVDGEDLWQTAQALLVREAVGSARPGDFNQAMMELGATVCVSGPPKCLLCPVAHFCGTRGELAAGPAKVKQKKRGVVYGLVRREEEVFLVQRGRRESLMAGMWELPELQSVNGDHTTLLNLKHSITVTDYAVRVVEFGAPATSPGKWFPESRLATLALTGLTRKILRRLSII